MPCTALHESEREVITGVGRAKCRGKQSRLLFAFLESFSRAIVQREGEWKKAFLLLVVPPCFFGKTLLFLVRGCQYRHLL